MKILIDARFWGKENTGPGRYTMSLVRALENIDSKNQYYLLLRKKYYTDDSLTFSANFHKTLADVSHYSSFEQVAIPAIVWRIKPDIVHYLHFNLPVLKLATRVVTVHDMLMHTRKGQSATTLPWYKYYVKRLGYRLVFNRAVNSADKIITPSNYVRKLLSNYYKISKNKIITTYEGVDPEVVGGGNRDGKKYFLYVGNAYPHKNIKNAIEAIKMFNDTVKPKMVIPLKIVSGRGVFQNRIRELADTLSATACVEILDFVENDELSVLYSNSLAYIFPSLDEGFGLPGIEAMSNETILCASDIEVFKEVYKDNAIYFNPHSVTDIAHAMNQVYQMRARDRKKIVKKAKTFSAQYTWSRTAKKTLNIYESCTRL